MSNKEAMLLFKDEDIATIEAMHDKLLDNGYALSDPMLVASRNLTERMYESLKWSSDECRINN